VTAPVRGNTPSRTATIAGGTGFTVSPVTWSGGSVTRFEPGVRYTATVTLTAAANHTFSGGLTGTVTINGQPARVTNNGNTAILSYQFPETARITQSGAPRNLSATAGNAQVTLSWIAPINYGGEITRYEVSNDNGVTWIPASSSTGHVFTGLTNGTMYTFWVRVVNSAGAGVGAAASAMPVAPGPAGNADVGTLEGATEGLDLSGLLADLQDDLAILEAEILEAAADDTNDALQLPELEPDDIVIIEESEEQVPLGAPPIDVTALDDPIMQDGRVLLWMIVIFVALAAATAVAFAIAGNKKKAKAGADAGTETK